MSWLSGAVLKKVGGGWVFYRLASCVREQVSVLHVGGDALHFHDVLYWGKCDFEEP